MERTGTGRLRSRRQAFRSIRRQLLHERDRLLLQTSARRPDQTTCEPAADVLDVAASERDVLFDDLMAQRAHLKLQQVERALLRLDDTSYGVCHLCRTDIPLPRLRAQPDATLCIPCKTECEDRILMVSRR
ncbi:MAG: hypothetical protein GDA66_02270 [Nitrospira sp. CR1.2]|nr:hypothetical protein [Nitrospira sp. CR1.2]